MILTGTCKWAKLRTPETYNGQEVGYTMCLYVSKEELNTFVEEALVMLEQAKGDDDRFRGKRWGKEPNLGVKEDADGNTYIRLKSKASYTNKNTGEEVKINLPIYDKYGQIFPEDKLIGNGSKVEVCVNLVPYHFSAQNNGISVQMRAVKVDELVEYNVDGFGFEFEEAPEQEEVEEDLDF